MLDGCELELTAAAAALGKERLIRPHEERADPFTADPLARPARAVVLGLEDHALRWRVPEGGSVRVAPPLRNLERLLVRRHVVLDLAISSRDVDAVGQVVRLATHELARLLERGTRIRRRVATAKVGITLQMPPLLAAAATAA